MDTKRTAPASGPGDEAEPGPSPALISQVRELIHVLTNTIQAARLFPADHQTVVGFISDLHERLTAYLDEHWKLEIGIEERALMFAGKIIHEEIQTAKSLPFFFFKDGMQAISFYKGLERDELKGFLDTIRAVAALPADEGDIVTALWERDFANIRYVAPDDYLETKIGQGRPPLEWKVDRGAMTTGRIDLSPEDLEDVRNRIFALQRGEEAPADGWAASPTENLGAPAGPSDASETREIETLIAANRRISFEDEYLSLMLEIIYLEDRAGELPTLAEIIRRCHQDLIARGDFSRAARLHRSLVELRDSFSEAGPEKSRMLAAALEDTTGQRAIDELEKSIEARNDGEEALFRYLGLIGPAAVRLVADLFDRAKTKSIREAALGTLKKIGEADVGILIPLPQESRPGLTKEIITLVSASRDKRVVPFLAGFLNSRDASVRLEAVRALGRIADDSSDKILQAFAGDQEESVRLAAFEGLQTGADPRVVKHVLDLAGGEAGLKKKSAAERKAFLSFLARSGSAEACAWLRRILARTPFLPDGRHTDLCFEAAATLETMAVPEARRALEEGARKRQRRVRQACLRALDGWPGPARGAASDRHGKKP